MEAGGSEDERKLVGVGWEWGVFRLICRETVFTVTSGAFLMSVQTRLFILVPNQMPQFLPNFAFLLTQRCNLRNPPSPLLHTPPFLFICAHLLSKIPHIKVLLPCCRAAGDVCTGKLFLALKCVFDGVSAAHDGWH